MDGLPITFPTEIMGTTRGHPRDILLGMPARNSSCDRNKFIQLDPILLMKIKKYSTGTNIPLEKNEKNISLQLSGGKKKKKAKWATRTNNGAVAHPETPRLRAGAPCDRSARTHACNPEYWYALL